jgi:outer membrane protein assembly factor BamB
MKKLNLYFFTLALLVIYNSCDNISNNTNNDDLTSNETDLEIYEWRGENRSGIYNETNLLKKWPEDGPVLVWEYDSAGNGYGSPIFTPDRMYLVGEIDSISYLFSFDNFGNLLWKKGFGKAWMKNYTGSRSAPTIVNDNIYIITGMGEVFCLDRMNGETLWSVDMINDLHGEFPLFGYSESPAIEKDMLFCMPGGKDTNVVALNLHTGDIIWVSKGAGERPGYNSSQIIELEDRNLLVGFSAYELLGLDTKTGEVLWVNKQDNVKPEERELGLGDTHSNTVIFDDGFIYYAAGDGNGGVKLALSEDGKNVKEVWRNKDFDSYMGGIVKLGDHLYGCGTAKRDFKSINAQSGELGKVLKTGSGSVIAADSMLYFYNWRGDVMLINEDPINMEIVSSFKIKKGSREHFAHPVINKGRLYIRHGNVIQAYDISE